MTGETMSLPKEITQLAENFLPTLGYLDKNVIEEIGEGKAKLFALQAAADGLTDFMRAERKSAPTHS